jgi:hypothetical protein
MHYEQDLPFQKVQHLYNPWNDGKPIKIGRDGQEIEPSKFFIPTLHFLSVEEIVLICDVTYFSSTKLAFISLYAVTNN